MTTRVVISNVYTDGNKGGAAITMTLVAWTKRLIPGARITIVPVVQGGRFDRDMLRFTLGAHPDVDIALPRTPGKGPFAGARLGLALLVNVLTKGRLFSSPASRAVRKADVVVGKGGQAMRGHGEPPIPRALSVWSTLHPLALGSRCGAHTSVHGVTLGPFSYREPTWRVVSGVLRRLDRVVVRTAEAVAECSKLGVDPDRVSIAPDIVFSWPTVKDDLARDNESTTLDPNDPPGPRLVVTIRAFEGYEHEPVAEWFVDVIRFLVEQDAIQEVVIVRHSIGTKGDREMSELLEKKLRPVISTRLDDGDHAPRALIDFYSNSAAVLAGRVHSSIFGIVSGTLAFPVDGFRHAKAKEILAEIGASDFAVTLPLPGEKVETSARAAADRILTKFENRAGQLTTLSVSLDDTQQAIGDSIADALGVVRPGTESGSH